MNFPPSSGSFNGIIRYMLNHDMKEYINLETSGDHFDDATRRDPWLIFDFDYKSSRWASSGTGDSQWIMISIKKYFLKLMNYTIRSVEKIYCLQGWKVEVSPNNGRSFKAVDAVDFTTSLYDFNPLTRSIKYSSPINAIKFSMIGSSVSDQKMRISGIELFGIFDARFSTYANRALLINRSIIFYLILLTS